MVNFCVYYDIDIPDIIDLLRFLVIHFSLRNPCTLPHLRLYISDT